MKLVCSFCRGYIERDDAIRIGIVSFCSQECVAGYRTKGRSRKSVGAARTTTKKRRSSKQQIPKELRDNVIAADGGICRSCGSKYSLHCHHVIYRSQGGKHERHNLITLCHDCHALVHSNKKIYQPILLGMIWLRDVMSDNSVTLQQAKERLYNG